MAHKMAWVVRLKLCSEILLQLGPDGLTLQEIDVKQKSPSLYIKRALWGEGLSALYKLSETSLKPPLGLLGLFSFDTVGCFNKHFSSLHSLTNSDECDERQMKFVMSQQKHIILIKFMIILRKV